jgi:uncharacterized protein
MVLNLTPMYHKAEDAFKKATSTAEKIAALEEMYALLPKHKASEKMQADLKTRLARLREAGQEEKARSGGPVDLFHVARQGAGQFLLFGAPNSGKSALVASLTKARVTVAAYPFSTHAPVPGMMIYEDVQIQLVDMPPVTLDGTAPGLLGAVRNADGLLICVDLSADVLDEVDLCLKVLASRGMVLEGQPIPEGGIDKRVLLVGTKLDLPGAADSFQALQELHAGLAPMMAVSAQTGENLAEISRLCFKALDVIRIYSKEPGKPADKEKPFVFPAGSTVIDLAAAIHHDLADNFKRARIWGANVYDGQSVTRDHALFDRDIVEIHV